MSDIYFAAFVKTGVCLGQKKNCFYLLSLLILFPTCCAVYNNVCC